MSKYSNRKYKCNGDRYSNPYPIAIAIMGAGVFLGYILHAVFVYLKGV